MATKGTDKGTETTKLDSFRKAFPSLTAIRTEKELEKLIAINSGVRKWNVQWKADQAVQLDMPTWLKGESKYLRDWETVRQARKTAKEKELQWSKDIKEASEQLKKEVKRVEEERSSLFGSLTALDIIDRVTVNQLPIDKALELAMFTGTEEKVAEKSKDLVLKYKTQLFKDFKANKFVNPFIEAQ